MMHLGDDEENRLPPAFMINELSKVPDAQNLEELDMSSIHLFDGDGGEVCSKILLLSKK